MEVPRGSAAIIAIGCVWSAPGIILAPMTTQTVGLVCAAIGVGFSVLYTVLGVSGIKLLRDMRKRMPKP